MSVLLVFKPRYNFNLVRSLPKPFKHGKRTDLQVIKMEKHTTIAVVLVLCILSASFGCINYPSSDYDENGGYTSIQSPEEPRDYFGVPAPVPAEKGGAESSYATTDTERKIIQTASLNIEVEDFQARSDALLTIVERANGFISDSHSYVTDTGHRRGDITIRVPQEAFLSTIAEIEQLGTVESKRTSGEDVTEEYIDLQARLNNSERQETRLLEILDMAEDVEDVLEVERELERVRGDIERLTGRITYLDNRIELATISVSLYEPEPLTHSWGLRDALRAAFEGFVAVILGLIIAIGYLLPFFILVGFGWLFKSKMLPRIRKRKQ
jgi:hypothetical protein